MSKHRFVETLIIGSGFAGSSVASKLDKESYLIVDRGEKPDIFSIRQKFLNMPKNKNNRHSKMIRDSYASHHPFNKPDTIAESCKSDYILIGDGCSNHWGGLTFRLSDWTIDRKNTEFSWPFSKKELIPYYEESEKVLNVSFDTKDPENRKGTALIEGVDYWHDLFNECFPKSYIGAQSHNLNLDSKNDQGLCAGAGDCELCPMDAKARSGNVFVRRNILYDTLCKKIIFKNGKAVKALCYSPKVGEFEIYFNRIVVAAHGVESVKLLSRSNLPNSVPHHIIGHHYQDHAIAQIYGVIKDPVKHWHLNTHSQIIIPELSGVYQNIEYTTLGLVGPATDRVYEESIIMDDIAKGNVKSSFDRLKRVMSFYILLDIPPEWDMYLKVENDHARLVDGAFFKNNRVYDNIVSLIKKKMNDHDIEVISSADILHYKKSYGTHHLVGTLNMSDSDKGIVNKDFSLKGVENLYIAGSSLFPRCGSRNPTLTVVALGLMLGDNIKRMS